MREVVNVRGKYFYDAHELATDPKYILFMSGRIKSTMPALVVFVGNRGENMYSMHILMIYPNDAL